MYPLCVLILSEIDCYSYLSDRIYITRAFEFNERARLTVCLCVVLCKKWI